MNTQHYADLLLSEKTKLIKQLSDIGHADPDNPRDWKPHPSKIDEERSDIVDTADNSEEYQENTAIVNELEIRLGAVEDALKQIDAGAYGICIECGEEIEEERLQANAAATTCKTHLK